MKYLLPILVSLTWARASAALSPSLAQCLEFARFEPHPVTRDTYVESCIFEKEPNSASECLQAADLIRHPTTRDKSYFRCLTNNSIKLQDCNEAIRKAGHPNVKSDIRRYCLSVLNF